MDGVGSVVVGGGEGLERVDWAGEGSQAEAVAGVEVEEVAAY